LISAIEAKDGMVILVLIKQSELTHFALFMHMGVQIKYVSKADGHPERE